jgi:enoyl-CoA hydratase/carnithine racemase
MSSLKLSYEHDGEVARMYLDELMAESDAVEGLRAFMEKREPCWGKKSVLA